MARGWTYRMPRCCRCGGAGLLTNSLGHPICPTCLAFERAVEAARAAAQAARNDPDAPLAPGSFLPSYADSIR